MRTSTLLPALLLLAACAEPSSTPDTAADSSATASGPPGTDIHLFRLTDSGPEHVAHVTDRDGYDNQPFFTPDGTSLLFTSDRAGNMDTWSYRLSDGSVEQVTSTEEGEYSPTVLPDDSGWFSVIRMDLEGVQELWRYPLDGTSAPSRVAVIDRVGYHTWVGNDRVLFFRLGSPATLQLVAEESADTTVIAGRAGRSLHRIPGQDASSYAVTLEDDSREIRRYDWATGSSTGLAVPVEGGQDYAWTPDGRLVMAVDGTLFAYRPGGSVDWEILGPLGLSNTSRLAVGPDGSLLAVVADRSE